MKVNTFWGIAVSAAAVLILTTCDFNSHEHSWQFASMDSPSTCSTEGVNLFYCANYDASNADECSIVDDFGNRQPMYFPRSVPIDLEAHAAPSITWARTLDPTCTGTGTDAGTCSDCNVNFTRRVPPQHSGAWTTTKEPLCEEYGVRTRICDICGKVDTGSEAPKGHSASWKTTREATCIFEGQESGYCTNCGKTVTQRTRALGHDWKITQGKAGFSCTRCGIWRLI